MSKNLKIDRNPSESRRPILDEMQLYVPGKSIDEVAREFGIKKIIKMASNENPLGSAVQNISKLNSILARSYFYPHHPAEFLKNLAKHLKVKPENLILGNGSDEIIQLLGLAFLEPGDQVITSEHTFSQYEFIAQLMNAQLTEIPMREFVYDLSAIMSAITNRTKLIFIANPNNPTGTYVPHNDLVSFIKKVPSHVLIALDEAYFEYAAAKDFPKSVQLLKKHSNVVLLRTFSKIYGLAGLRIGYGIGDASLIQILNKVRPPFNVNLVAVEAAKLALANQKHVKKSVKVNEDGKKFLVQELKKINLEFLPTQGNFVMIHLPRPASEISRAMMAKGVIVRALTSFGFPNAIRVTVGTHVQNLHFIKVLKSVLRE